MAPARLKEDQEAAAGRGHGRPYEAHRPAGAIAQTKATIPGTAMKRAMPDDRDMAVPATPSSDAISRLAAFGRFHQVVPCHGQQDQDHPVAMSHVQRLTSAAPAIGSGRLR